MNFRGTMLTLVGCVMLRVIALVLCFWVDIRLGLALVLVNLANTIARGVMRDIKEGIAIGAAAARAEKDAEDEQ